GTYIYHRSCCIPLRTPAASLVHDAALYLLITLTLLSTLFPYTTLFRSTSIEYSPLGNSRKCSLIEPIRRRISSWERKVGVPPPQDRKSTRLNSSHVKISYAVLCLKKKNVTDV